MEIPAHKVKDENNYLPTILYVDDEKISCRYFERICKNRFNVKTVFSGAEALQYLHTNHAIVNLLVTDQKMPDMQGTELLSLVKNIYPNIIKIITTAFMTEADANMLMKKYDITSFIYKSWDIDQLLATLESSIDY